MLLDAAATIELETKPRQAGAELRDVTCDVGWIVTYKQGYFDACDGVGPFREYEAYRRGWNSGNLFRSRITDYAWQALPEQRQFCGWPSCDLYEGQQRPGADQVAAADRRG
jgi:hypothetical protein